VPQKCVTDVATTKQATGHWPPATPYAQLATRNPQRNPEFTRPPARFLARF